MGIRTKIGCLNWPTNFNKRSKLIKSKLKRLKRLLLLIWPNIAKPNKDLKKLKKGPNWLELHFLWPVVALLLCNHFGPFLMAVGLQASIQSRLKTSAKLFLLVF